MSNLYNIKSITLNGNEITKLATFYNENQTSKEKTVMSVKAAEELVSSKVPVSHKDIHRKFFDNVNSNSITYTTTGEDNFDDIHGFPIELNGSYFYYKCSASNPMTTTDGLIFIGKSAKSSDNIDAVYALDSSKQIYLNTNSSNVVLHIGDDIYNNLTLVNAYFSNSTISIYGNQITKMNVKDRSTSESGHYSDARLFTNADYETIGLSSTVTVMSNINSINLSDKFFKFENIDTVDLKQFGNWQGYKGILYIDADGINTALIREDDVIARLKQVLALSDPSASIVLENSHFEA